jgi:hypothetical protein
MAKQLEFLRADGLLNTARDYEVFEGIENLYSPHTEAFEAVSVAAE